MKNEKYLYIVIAVAALVGTLIFFRPTKGYADLLVVSDTLSTSRLSVAARVLTINGNLVTIDPTTAAGFYSTSSANLKPQDSITINGGAQTVNNIENSTANQFTTTAAAPSGAVGNSIYYISQPVHQITFTTTTSVPAGFFRVLIPAGASTNNDGNPDPDGFDFNSMTSTYASASGTANIVFVTAATAATASGGTNCTAGYHCFEFHYTGTGNTGSTVTLWIGNATKSLVAPAPKSGHNLGAADAYTIKVQQFANASNPTGTPIDATNGKVALIEAVRVTATVDPIINFSITGVPASTTACGVSTTVATDTNSSTITPLSVPFGTLSLNTFATAAHNLVVSTNAANGYIVTAIENQKMGKDGLTTSTIPDATCGATPCTVTSAQNWNVATGYPGFGYSLESVSGATVPFTAGASFNARPFANNANLNGPTIIMSSTGIANSHIAHVCYRISVDATQAAGDYENQITYTATASF